MFKKASVMKVIVLLLSVIMIFGLFGCAKTGDGDTTTTTTTKAATTTTTTAAATTTTETQQGSMDKTLEIVFGVAHENKIADNCIIKQTIEEKFNVKLSYIQYGISDEAKINLMLASGDVPDAFRPGYFTIQKVWDSASIRTIPQEYIRSYAPNFSKFLDENYGWLLNREPGRTDSHTALAGIDATVKGTYYVPTLRLDWLENADCPVKPKGTLIDFSGNGRMFYTTEAFTIEELEKILIYFTKGDPDKNGQDDTYGMSPYWGHRPEHFMTIAGSFGVMVRFGQWYNSLGDDGQLYPQQINPNLPDYLKTINRWYEMGLIDPEFITNTRTISHEKYANGKAGYIATQISYFNVDNPGLAAYFPVNAINANPNAKILVTPPEIGKMQAIPKQYVFSPLGYPFVIGRQVDDEKLIRIIQMYDYLNFQDEGYVLARFGIEGIHFDWAGEPYESTAVRRADAPADAAYNSFINSVWADTYLKCAYNDSQKMLMNYFQYGEGAKYATIDTYTYDFFNTTNLQSEMIPRYWDALNGMFNEYVIDAITGEIKVDDTWESYVTEWRKQGGDAVIAVMKKCTKVEDLEDFANK